MSDHDQPADNLADAFDRYHEHLKLDPDERNAARDMHHEIRDALNDADVIQSAFLQGSFARKTMLAPLKDIDLIVVLSSRLDALREDPTGPSKSTQQIVDVLSVTFPDATFETGRHAVKIDFGADGFTFDCVPAFEVGNDAGDVLIANTDDETWDESNTWALIRCTQERNQECGGRWVHQARMAKDFAAKALQHSPDKLPGLICEAICHEAITTQRAHPDAMADVLIAGAQMLLAPVKDPTGFDVLTDRVPYHVLRTAQQAFEAAADTAEQALALAAKGDEAAAIDLWHSILGDGFPPAPDPSVDDAVGNLLAGGHTRTGRPVARQHAEQPARPTRAWRSR